MRARLHKVLRDISGYRTRTALVVASIALGVIAVGAITQTRIVLDRELDAAYLATDPADATLALTPFDEAFVDAIESRPDVAAAEGRRLVTVQLQTAPDWVVVLIAAITGLMLGFGAWLFAYLFVPETKGKSLEEIQATWAHR